MNEESAIQVSVIMPVYNTEPFLQQAVESVRAQTLRNIEIIVMNDGSTDKSMQIIEEQAAQDNRIRVLSQENQGNSAARNNAFKAARGKYVYFMDSDDVIEEETLEACLAKCEAHELDFVFFDADILNKESLFSLPLLYDRSACTPAGEVHTGSRMLRVQLEGRRFTPSVCLNLIRRTFLQSTGLQFFPGILHEDQLFTTLLYLQADRVMYIPRKFFKRRFREASIMTKRFSWRNMAGYIKVTDEMLRFKESTASEEQTRLIDLHLQLMLDTAVWQAYVFPLKERLRLFSICHRPRYRKYIRPRTRLVMVVKPFLRRSPV